MAGDVFISHASEDAKLAQLARDALEDSGVSCWIAPRDIRPGETWSAIVSAIEASRMLLVVLSGHANASREVLREVEQASRTRKQLLVLRLEDVEPSIDLAFFLTSTQWLDAFPPPLRPRLDRLVETAARLLGRDVPVVDAPATELVEVDLDDFGRGRRPEFVDRLFADPTRESLASKLREAALLGVVPVSASAAKSIAPSREAEAELLEAERIALEARERDRVALEADVADRHLPQEARRRAEAPRWEAARPAPQGKEDPSRLRLLRFAVPLALLGGALAALKWLFGVGFVVDADRGPPDTVECTVFAPPSAAPGESILVQAFLHRPEQADDARAIAVELDIDAQRRTYRTLESPVGYSDRLAFRLRLPGLEVDDPVASLEWRGRTEAVQFGVHIPPSARAGTVIGTLDVDLNGAPVGNVKFKLTVDRTAGGTASEPQGERADRYTFAFISYASKDRDKVLARVQMLSAVGIRYFQDVLSLAPGDRWATRLELGIDDCDLFLLFWSNEAKRSEWVRREVEYALARKGGDELSPPEIRPVIIEGPQFVEPWEELADFHFGDPLLNFMSAR